MTVPENPPKRHVWPADYYSSPTPNPVLPRGVTFGCGAAAVVVLLAVVAGGAWLASGGDREFFGFVVGMTAAELPRQYAGDVTNAQKKAVSTEVDTLLRNLREGHLGSAAVQPLLQELRVVGADRKITAAEANQLEATLKKINAKAKPRRV